MSEIELAYIGGPDSGKTCAIACLHEALVRGISVETDGGNERLCLRPESPEPFPEKDAAYLHGGRLPSEPSNFNYCEYTLQQNRQAVCSVNVTDYAGYILTQNELRIPGDQYFADSCTPLFMETLRTTCLLVYVIPGDILAMDRQMEEMEARRKTGAAIYRKMENQVSAEINLLKSVMNSVQEMRKGHPPLLLFATKCDLIQQDMEVPHALLRLVQRHNLFFPGTELLGCGATLGKKVRIDGTDIVGGYAPEGFSIPLLLAVGRHLQDKCCIEALKISEQLRWKEFEEGLQGGRRMWLLDYLLTGLVVGPAGAAEEAKYARIHSREHRVRERLQTTLVWKQLQTVRACLEKSGVPILYLDDSGEQKKTEEFLRFQQPEILL